jgi:hypothetical protein
VIFGDEWVEFANYGNYMTTLMSDTASYGLYGFGEYHDAANSVLIFAASY